ncbi:hypothetical protein LMH87_004536 [Akanthomyces muscarius]|uniref:Uncharacterized protein n=1 Tax=Akanthomyces muscarius TaxID=2231603 RepID=A0A9W8Q5U8_AKAMU|nr:hypothetical protein LMH87_004536 [Akanthomyces muscarius]KAJ4145697.1 hypothetical protein LMH87_004536 [Akanthomyces muscarius]
MVTNLEGLLERIVLLSSCAGEQGCPVSELLASILVLLSISEREPSQTEIVHILENPQSDAYRTTAVIWTWVAERKDISVGYDRKYNAYPLTQILSLGTKSPVVEASAPAPPSETITQEKEAVRIYVSENTMWESLTGHGVDHKRIPRSEWILLQGIASTTGKGILQGDLEKGYITKRTTLVRGTKTSKLWLKFLAPSTPDETKERNETETNITLSRQCLVDSLEPVPWHTRWTGDSIDYKVLATTVMAICKEWNVMRLQDLKSKLGVLGMTWQMKVVSKICRFLNSRGTIRYVAAKLNNRIFKDCIRFNRDMNARDWSIFLATGKRTTKYSRLSTQENGEDEIITTNALRGVQGFGESQCPLWSIYTPITSLVALCIEEAGSDGLTNPQLCAITIGSSFTRYLAGLTAAISTDNIQPSNVRHLAVKSERGRPGKSSSLYWYSMVNLGTQQHDAPQKTHQSKPKRKQDSSRSSELYGFTSLALGNVHTAQASRLPSTLPPTLSDLCQRGLSQQKRRGRPKKIRPELRNGSHDVLPRESTAVRNTAIGGVREAAARSVVMKEERDTAPSDQAVEREPHGDTVEVEILDERPGDQIPEPAVRGRGRPRIRDDGQTGRKAPSNHQFRCENCSDMSILSGQAELLTAISALPPRQVDPFAKPYARQAAVQLHAISEVPEAHAAGLALTLQDFAATADSVKDTPERPRMKITRSPSGWEVTRDFGL